MVYQKMGIGNTQKLGCQAKVKKYVPMGPTLSYHGDNSWGRGGEVVTFSKYFTAISPIKHFGDDMLRDHFGDDRKRIFPISNFGFNNSIAYFIRMPPILLHHQPIPDFKTGISSEETLGVDFNMRYIGINAIRVGGRDIAVRCPAII